MELHLLLDSRATQAAATALATISRRTVRAILSLTQSPAPAVLVVASSQCSPAECARLVSEGRDVIILAAVPRTADERAYMAAGAAAYLAMSIDTRPLLDVIEALEGRRLVASLAY